jgi:hypothetical protein
MTIRRNKTNWRYQLQKLKMPTSPQEISYIVMQPGKEEQMRRKIELDLESSFNFRAINTFRSYMFLLSLRQLPHHYRLKLLGCS